VIVDDQQLVRVGFQRILETEPGIEVVGEAADGAEAIELVRWRRPDVVLMDIQMPVMDGLEATRRILESTAEVSPRIIILTTFELDEYVFEALRAGASGFLIKNTPPEVLVEAIQSVVAGGGLLSPAVTAKVIGAFAHRRATDRDARRLANLTEREREVLVLVGRGLSNAEIAERLVLGEATIKTHVSNILAKLELRDRIGAVILAYESGLIEIGEPDSN
jgi:DNA-binding NarL/FixJ family response regulator